MVIGYCRTNLDGYGRCQWPTRFVDVPRVGERMRTVGSDRRTLAVHGVTHCIAEDGSPFIEVELNK